jgi:hypothetical protein
MGAYIMHSTIRSVCKILLEISEIRSSATFISLTE